MLGQESPRPLRLATGRKRGRAGGGGGGGGEKTAAGVSVLPAWSARRRRYGKDLLNVLPVWVTKCMLPFHNMFRNEGVNAAISMLPV